VTLCWRFTAEVNGCWSRGTRGLDRLGVKRQWQGVSTGIPGRAASDGKSEFPAVSAVAGWCAFWGRSENGSCCFCATACCRWRRCLLR
jgi:hypothetical protein